MSTSKNEIDSLGGAWSVAAKFRSSTSKQSTKSSTSKEERSFDMFIEVIAGADDMPSGTSRLLDILEKSITSTPNISSEEIVRFEGYETGSDNKTLQIKGTPKLKKDKDGKLEEGLFYEGKVYEIQKNEDQKLTFTEPVQSLAKDQALIFRPLP